MKLPFRKQKPSDLPKEVQDYYQAEKREKVGVAGLLAVATLVVTVLLAMGLFFGGRWAYRAVFDNDDNKVAQQDQETEDTQGNQPAEQPVDSGDQAEQSNDQPAAPAPQSTPAPSPTPSSNIPSTGPSDGLPSTGPADTAAVVLATIVLSGSVFYVVRRPQE